MQRLTVHAGDISSPIHPTLKGYNRTGTDLVTKVFLKCIKCYKIDERMHILCGEMLKNIDSDFSLQHCITSKSLKEIWIDNQRIVFQL